MIAPKRTLLIGGVGLVKGNTSRAGPVMREVCDELEPALLESSFIDSAPFKTISLIVRFGERERLDAEYYAIDSRHSELPVSVELPMSVLRAESADSLKRRILSISLSVLEDVSRKYNLPYKEFEMLRRQGRG